MSLRRYRRACDGSYAPPIRRHPVTGAGECPICGRRFDHADMAGIKTRLSTDWRRQGGLIPLHSEVS